MFGHGREKCPVLDRGMRGIQCWDKTKERCPVLGQGKEELSVQSTDHRWDTALQTSHREESRRECPVISGPHHAGIEKGQLGPAQQGLSAIEGLQSSESVRSKGTTEQCICQQPRHLQSNASNTTHLQSSASVNHQYPTPINGTTEQCVCHQPRHLQSYASVATKGPKELYICQSPISYTYQ